jgi:hypothetical protein
LRFDDSGHFFLIRRISDSVVMTNSPNSSSHRHLALLGGFKRQGKWTPEPKLTSVSPVGGVNLDLTDATLPAEMSITKVSIAGGVNLRVPADVRVEVVNHTLLGRTNVASGTGGGPLIRVHAIGVVGGITVVRT